MLILQSLRLRDQDELTNVYIVNVAEENSQSEEY